MLKVDVRNLNSMFNQLEQISTDLPEETYQEFKKNTPIRTGNARKNTKRRGDTIIADYPYAQRLDSGWSKQAPDGMVTPTEEWLQKEVNRKIKGIK